MDEWFEDIGLGDEPTMKGFVIKRPSLKKRKTRMELKTL